MLIVAKQDVAGFIDVAGPVLCLAVNTHDAIVSSNPLIVLRRNAAGVVQGALAGEHHGRAGRHDENATGVHEHGGLGIPIGLRPHVDPVNEEIDFAARLRKFD